MTKKSVLFLTILASLFLKDILCPSGIYSQQVPQPQKWTTLFTSSLGYQILQPWYGSSKIPTPYVQPQSQVSKEKEVLQSLEEILRTTFNIPEGWQLPSSLSYEDSKIICTFQPQLNGIPVQERFIRVILGTNDHKILLVKSYLPSFGSINTAFLLDSNTIKTKLTFSERFRDFIPTGCVPILSINEEQLRTAYAVQLKSTDSLLEVTVDASNGQVLSSRSLLYYSHLFSGSEILTGKVRAKVHLRTPTDTLSSVALRSAYLTINGKKILTDSNGAWSGIDLSSPFHADAMLEGKFISITRKDNNPNASFASTITPLTGEIEWNNNNSDPAERDVFYHVNLLHDHVKQIKPALINLDTHIVANVNISSVCNAFYNTDDLTLNFFNSGGDCANTGEIADIIYHEYGHHIIHCHYWKSSRRNLLNGSLQEGFADVISSFMRDDPRIGLGFVSGEQFIRNSDNKLTWPDNVNADSHMNGSIIAGAFWDLRKKIGLAEAEKLFYGMLSLQPDGPTSTSIDASEAAFVDALVSTILADDNDNNQANGTPHLQEILDAFARHGITLSSSIQLALKPIPDQDSLVTSYPVTLTVKNLTGIGSVVENSVKVFYSTDGVNYKSIALTKADTNLFQGTLPKQPSGSIVRYYASAMANIGSENALSAASANEPLVFVVGFHQVFSEDFEKENSWQTNISGDNALTGIWTRDIPVGTYNTPGDFVQQDTDHTPLGSYCYVTGNNNKAGMKREIGYDDVDQGQTTLLSPSIQLTPAINPVLRYWYYYSNNQGQNPGRTTWVAQLSTDNGFSWKDLQRTTTSTAGWQNASFVLKEITPELPAIKLRFVASDNIAAAVEAGVDDIEILDASSIPSSVNAYARNEKLLLNPPYPNPALRNLQFTYVVPTTGTVRISIKNVLGETVRVVESGNRLPGNYHAEYSISDLAPGNYWLQLDANGESRYQHLIISR